MMTLPISDMLGMPAHDVAHFSVRLIRLLALMTFLCVSVQSQLQNIRLLRSPKKKFQILCGVSGILKPVRPW